MLRAQRQLHESGSTGRAVRGGGVSFSSALSQASAGKRRAQLGMYYDDVCRRAAAELRCARARARAVARRSGPSAPARRTPISCCSARSCASISGCLAWPRRPTTATSARRGRLSTRARARGGCRVFSLRCRRRALARLAGPRRATKPRPLRRVGSRGAAAPPHPFLSRSAIAGGGGQRRRREKPMAVWPRLRKRWQECAVVGEALEQLGLGGRIPREQLGRSGARRGR